MTLVCLWFMVVYVVWAVVASGGDDEVSGSSGSSESRG